LNPEIKEEDFNTTSPLWSTLSRALSNLWAEDTNKDKEGFYLTDYELSTMKSENFKEYIDKLGSKDGKTLSNENTKELLNALKRRREKLAKKMNEQIRTVKQHIFARKVS